MKSKDVDYEMKSDTSTFRGIARNVNWRKKGGENPIDVLTFRIERIDGEGNLIDYIPVTMEGDIKGGVVDGDEIEVVGRINKEGLLIPNKILNLKTRAHIMKSDSKNKVFVIFLFPFIFGIIGLIGGIEGFVAGFIFGGFLAVFIFFILVVVSAFRS